MTAGTLQQMLIDIHLLSFIFFALKSMRNGIGRRDWLNNVIKLSMLLGLFLQYTCFHIFQYHYFCDNLIIITELKSCFKR